MILPIIRAPTIIASPIYAPLLCRRQRLGEMAWRHKVAKRTILPVGTGSPRAKTPKTTRLNLSLRNCVIILLEPRELASGLGLVGGARRIGHQHGAYTRYQARAGDSTPLVAAIIPDDELANRTEPDIILFKDKNRKLFEQFSYTVQSIMKQVSSLLASADFERMRSNY